MEIAYIQATYFKLALEKLSAKRGEKLYHKDVVILEETPRFGGTVYKMLITYGKAW